MTKEYWITNSRFKFIAVLLFLMFLIFMFVIYLKADGLIRNACQICAKKMGDDVHCYVGNLQRTFYPNFSIVDNSLG